MWVVLLIFTPVIGLFLSELEQYRIHQFFNVLSAIWAFFGFCVLSYLVGTSDKVINTIVRISSYILKWLLFMVPWGIIAGGLMGRYFSNPSWEPATKTGLYLLLPAIVSVFFIEDFSEAPKFKFAKSEKFRVAFLGGYFILAGLLLQITSAIFDLVGFNG